MSEVSCPATPPLTPIDSKNGPISRWDETPEREKPDSPTGSRSTSPENCAICLGALSNKSFTDSCLHTFCFVCLVEWSKVKPECPLCKVGFKTIIHNVRSKSEFERYDIKQSPPAFRHFSGLNRPYFTWIQQHAIDITWRSRDVLPSRPPTAFRRIRERERPGTAAFRRNIYESNQWAHCHPDVTGRYRECSAQFYRTNPAQLHRIVPFINRELTVLLNNASRMMDTISQILDLMQRYDITDVNFHDRICGLIGTQYAAHFCHELRCFATSPYDLRGYDREVSYSPYNNSTHGSATLIRPPASEVVVQRISDTDTDSSSDNDVQVVGQGRRLPFMNAIYCGRICTTTSTATSVTSEQSQVHSSREPTSESSERLSPQPGTSGLSSKRRISVIPILSSSSEDSDDEVQIVGYVKPRHERTPEIITLSSPEHKSPTPEVPISPRSVPNMSFAFDSDDETPQLKQGPNSEDSTLEKEVSSRIRRSKRIRRYASQNAFLNSLVSDDSSDSFEEPVFKRKSSANSNRFRQQQGKHRKSSQISDSDSSECMKKRARKWKKCAVGKRGQSSKRSTSVLSSDTSSLENYSHKSRKKSTKPSPSRSKSKNTRSRRSVESEDELQTYWQRNLRNYSFSCSSDDEITFPSSKENKKQKRIVYASEGSDSDSKLKPSTSRAATRKNHSGSSAQDKNSTTMKSTTKNRHLSPKLRSVVMTATWTDESQESRALDNNSKASPSPPRLRPVFAAASTPSVSLDCADKSSSASGIYEEPLDFHREREKKYETGKRKKIKFRTYYKNKIVLSSSSDSEA